MNELLDVLIEKLVAGGYGLARTAAGVLLVRGALPGEELRVRVTEARGTRFADVETILRPSPDRVEAHDLPPTLDLAHARYAAQCALKSQIVEDALLRTARVQRSLPPATASPLEWHYRATTQYAVSGGHLAYRERGSAALRPVQADPLAAARINEMIRHLDRVPLAPVGDIVLRASFLTGELLAGLMAANAAEIPRALVDSLVAAGADGIAQGTFDRFRFRDGARMLWGRPTIRERYGHLDLSVSVAGFAQVNPPAASALYLRALEVAGTGSAALDLFGGSGAMGLHLARAYGEVTVLDIHQESLDRGEQDALRLGIDNVRFVRGDARRFRGRFDLVVLDPPRAGVDRRVLERIHASRADRLLYIACDPVTWARDVAVLLGRGWRLAAVEPWDLFPQTAHVEVLSLLER